MYYVSLFVAEASDVNSLALLSAQAVSQIFVEHKFRWRGLIRSILSKLSEKFKLYYDIRRAKIRSSGRQSSDLPTSHPKLSSFPPSNSSPQSLPLNLSSKPIWKLIKLKLIGSWATSRGRVLPHLYISLSSISTSPSSIPQDFELKLRINRKARCSTSSLNEEVLL